MIAGNTVLYGAISGEAYFYGIAGERFAVRNSGALAVAEGCGDHGCEYMTGGTVVILGETGRNFAAGMSGGVAYVYDPDKTFERRCNLSMVTLEPVLSCFEQEASVEKAVWHRLSRHGQPQTDEAILKHLIENHFTYTGSMTARRLLEDWSNCRSCFVKVFPMEYRRALQDLYAEEKSAEDNVAVVAA